MSVEVHCHTVEVHCHTAEDTLQLGVRLGAAAGAGAVLTLDGPLGAGKTVLAKGIGRGLGTPTTIASPTFILLALHEGGRLPLFHADLYRLGDASELDVLGLEDAVHGVLLVEWASLFPDELPADRLHIDIAIERPQDPAQAESRRIHLTPHGPRSVALLEAAGVG